MSEFDLDAIRTRAARMLRIKTQNMAVTKFVREGLKLVEVDIPALLDEIERLRAELVEVCDAEEVVVDDASTGQGQREARP